MKLTLNNLYQVVDGQKVPLVLDLPELTTEQQENLCWAARSGEISGKRFRKALNKVLKAKNYKLITYEWAADLHQWISGLPKQVTVERTRHGKTRVVGVAYGHHQRGFRLIKKDNLVFDKEGNCVSYHPSRKAIAAGALERWPKLIESN